MHVWGVHACVCECRCLWAREEHHCVSLGFRGTVSYCTRSLPFSETGWAWELLHLSPAPNSVQSHSTVSGLSVGAEDVHSDSQACTGSTASALPSEPQLPRSSLLVFETFTAHFWDMSRIKPYFQRL